MRLRNQELAKARDILVEDLCERGDDEVVIVALRQTRHHDAADGARAFEQDGKTAAMHSEVGCFEAVSRLQRLIIGLKNAADGVGAASEAMHDIALAANPVGLPGVGGGSGAGEEEMIRELDFDGAPG